MIKYQFIGLYLWSRVNKIKILDSPDPRTLVKPCISRCGGSVTPDILVYTQAYILYGYKPSFL